MEVCYESGFNELTTFSRAYKKLFGISPGKSRKIEKNKEENKEEKHWTENMYISQWCDTNFIKIKGLVCYYKC